MIGIVPDLEKETKRPYSVRYSIHLSFNRIRAADMARKLCNIDRQVILKIQYNPEWLKNYILHDNS